MLVVGDLPPLALRTMIHLLARIGVNGVPVSLRRSSVELITKIVCVSSTNVRIASLTRTTPASAPFRKLLMYCRAIVSSEAWKY